MSLLYDDEEAIMHGLMYAKTVEGVGVYCPRTIALVSLEARGWIEERDGRWLPTEIGEQAFFHDLASRVTETDYQEL